MSIGDFVNGCTLLLRNGAYDPAMCLAMNALDATAQREYPQLSGSGNVKARFVQAVRDNYDIVSAVGSGGAFYSAVGSRFELNNPDGSSPAGPLENILYASVRCYLTHEALLPAGCYFNEQAILGKLNQSYSIPVHFIVAILLAIVGAKSNSNELSDANVSLNALGKAIPISNLWGQAGSIRSVLGLP